MLWGPSPLPLSKQLRWGQSGLDLYKPPVGGNKTNESYFSESYLWAGGALGWFNLERNIPARVIKRESMFPKKSESPISKKVKEWFPTWVPVRDDGTWKYCPYCLPETSLLCFPHLGLGISRSTFLSSRWLYNCPSIIMKMSILPPLLWDATFAIKQLSFGVRLFLNSVFYPICLFTLFLHQRAL